MMTGMMMKDMKGMTMTDTTGMVATARGETATMMIEGMAEPETTEYLKTRASTSQ